ncbi:NAD(P)/FAD-dependent oxidoreductase [Sphingobacterium oryzagri]|uniref:NAD(P)/FAD-dependent oxidoreductase n=1 Tax=Sphingobacterium oryzagri TaxID=3025669 RepID=A0ABY7WB73_9SPHI|nr:NAD(P)/FAD-dependent oxidoreductase [Sphingobacterium sp. KACC 22765]WDF66921.1 NAD(P)/FAD-dependent oxidoreductase [Sphingobacterium sp. KACC 22765]
MYDTIIIGGSYAGLSAGLALARFRRRILIIDDGNPCNKNTKESHNFVGHDGESPSSIIKSVKSQLLQYETVDFLHDSVSEVHAFSEYCSATFRNNKVFHARKLLLACGITDLLPPIEGFGDCWGISIIDCPYCHGYEFRDKKAVVLGTLKKVKKIVTLLKPLHADIDVIEPSPPLGHKEEGFNIAADSHIDNFYSAIKSIRHKNGLVQSIIFQNDETKSTDLIYAPRPFELSGNLHAQLGCKKTKHGYISVNKKQLTSVRHVYACGDNSNLLRSISSAVYSGTKAGMMINSALAVEHERT